MKLVSLHLTIVKLSASAGQTETDRRTDTLQLTQLQTSQNFEPYQSLVRIFITPNFHIDAGQSVCVIIIIIIINLNNNNIIL